MTSLDAQAAQRKIDRIAKLLTGHTNRAEEAEVLALLRGAQGGELDFILSHLCLSDVLSGVDDRLIGPDNRTALLKFLCEERLDELSIPVRAVLVGVLQQGRTDGIEERCIEHIFLGTRGAALTQLKNAVDGSGDYHDLHQLIYHDIDDADVRSRILSHIAAEAQPRSDLKILSDVDDTLYRNWKDPRWPNKTIYPGVRAFYEALDRAGAPDDGLGDLTFLTARPGDRAGISEGITLRNLAERKLGYAKVLTGDFGHLATHQLMADKKFSGFCEYRKLFPEYGFVFLGDSGQGDAIAGERMRDEHGSAMRAVFIHDVINTAEGERARLRAKRVYFNDTYIGAALDAHALGILSLDALAGVARAAVAEFLGCAFESGAQKEARLGEFRRDLARVNSLLPAGSAIML